MKNARNKESRNRDSRTNPAASSVATGSTNNDGDRIRTDDGNKSPVDSGNSTGQSGATANGVNVESSVGRNQSVEIADGYYFTPRGTVERIPDGHYIDNSGRLRKRRQQRTSNNAADGNAHRDRSETGETPQSSTEDFLLDAPLNVRGKRGRKAKVKEETSKLTLVTMLSTASVALFSSIELLTKHEHWALEKTEAQILAEALNEALATLPAKYYDSIIGVIEKYVPWVNLAFVVGAIVIPRIEASGKRIEAKHYKPSETSNRGDAGTENNPFSNWTSLGWNGR
jgi:hypothetical protein